MGPSLGDLAARTNSTLRQIGILFTAGWLGYLIGALLGGRLYDRVIGHPVMAASLVVMAVALVLVLQFVLLRGVLVSSVLAAAVAVMTILGLRAGDSYTLLLATAQHMGEFVDIIFHRVELDFAHYLLDAFFTLIGIFNTIHNQGLRQNAADTHEGRQRAVRVLLHEPDFGAEVPHFPGA